MAAPPFQVRTSGLIDRQRYHSTPGTRMGDYMLTVFLDGRGRYRNSHGQTDVVRGMVGVVPPRDEGILMADPEDPYVHYYCRFCGSWAVRMAEEILRQHDARFFAVPDAQEIAGCLRQMGRHSSHDLPSRLGMREAMLCTALVRLAGADMTGRRAGVTEAALIEYLRAHMAETTDVERMARRFHVCKSSLCRAAKRLTGTTLVRLHERMKIEWAQALLRLGEFSVAEVALRVGYRDPFYFSRVFKKHVGVSPSAWQRGER